MAYRLALKDIRNEYAASAFGMLWDLLDPFVLGAIFYFLMHASVLDPGAISIPYAVFVVYGVLLYQTFVDSMLLSVNILSRSKGLLTHLNLPAEALLLSVFYRVAFLSSFRILVMLFFSILGGALDIVGFTFFIVLFPVYILAAMSLGVFFAPFNAIYKDVGKAIQMLLLPLRYLSLVFFLLPGPWMMELVFKFNFVALFLSNMRLLATTGTITHPFEMCLQGVVLLLFGVVGWFIFHVSIPILAERA